VTIRYSSLIAAIAGLAGGAAAAQDACGPLTRLELEHTTVVSAANVPGDTAKRAPAYCEVHAAITPVPGSKIGAVFRLPENWNGKMLGIGGGGFAGNVRADSAADGLGRGYAVIQNDMGHPSESALDPSFAVDAGGHRNVEGVVDARIVQRLDYPQYILEVDQAKASAVGLDQTAVMQNVVSAFNSSVRCRTVSDHALHVYAGKLVKVFLLHKISIHITDIYSEITTLHRAEFHKISYYFTNEVYRNCK